MSEHKSKRILLFVLLAMLTLPAFMHLVGINPDRKLAGAVTKTNASTFSDTSWFSGNYQKEAELYLNANFKSRRFLIRLHHQLAYSLFDKIGAKNVIIGKNGYLYEEPYIHAYFGDDFVGDTMLRAQLTDIKRLQDLLQQEGKLLVVLYAPGKGAFYPEFIPDSFRHERGPTNHDVCVKLSEELGVSYIDMYSWFLNMRDDKSPYPLYPKYGTHWSRYGAFLAMDSLQGYLSQKMNMPLPRVHWDHVELTTKAREPDRDISDAFNLMFPFHDDLLAYPDAYYTAPPNPRVNPVFVGDSYFFTMRKNKYLSDIYPQGQFWYYNKEIYIREDIGAHSRVEKHDLSILMKDKNVFVIVCTDIHLNDIGWGFVKNAIAVLAKPLLSVESYVEIEKIMQNMKSDPKFLDYLQQKAKAQYEPIYFVMLRDAIWLYSKEKNE